MSIYIWFFKTVICTVLDEWTDRWTDAQPETHMCPQLLQLGGIIITKYPTYLFYWRWHFLAQVSGAEIPVSMQEPEDHWSCIAQRGITPEREITRPRKKGVLAIFPWGIYIWFFKTVIGTVLVEWTDRWTDAQPETNMCPQLLLSPNTQLICSTEDDISWHRSVVRKFLSVCNNQRTIGPVSLTWVLRIC